LPRRFVILVCILLAAALFSGYISTKTESGSKRKVAIELEQTALSVKSWKMDNSHLAPLSGKLLLDGRPVSGVQLRLSGKRVITTEEDGGFKFLVDRSIPQTLLVLVQSADGAELAGKPLGESDKKALLSAKGTVDVFYPIQITKVNTAENDADLVEVHAQAITENLQDFPVATLIQYAIKGTVRTADGTPVQGAIVSFTRNSGQGRARSEPSNEKGEYILYYSPDEQEDLYLNVHVGQTHYKLPENKVYHFPEDTSMQTDITLPAEGNIITDKPPTLVSIPAKGAVYWSLMVGLSVNDQMKYSVTLPNKDGSFVLTVPKKVWDQYPSFFETRVTRFLTDPISAGYEVPSSFLPVPQPDDPKRIVAKKKEPVK
jgi:hypothetical protein